MDLQKLKNPRTIAYVGGGAVILYLLYRYFAGGSSSNGSPTTATPDQTGVTAAEQVGAQEASDVSALQGMIDDLGDVLNDLGGQITGLTDQTDAINVIAGDVAHLASGEKKQDRKLQGLAKHQKALEKGAKKARHGAKRPRGHHAKAHQSNRKQAGSGSVAPSHHINTHGTKKAKKK